MKNSIIILMVFALASCHNYQRDAEQLQSEVDSLEAIAVQQDSTIEVFLNDFSEIQANLDSIKKMERLITGAGETEGVLSGSQKEQIMANIAAINGLLGDNQELISSMKQRLSSSNIQTGKLKSMVSQMEEETNNLEQRIQKKDSEISQLTQRIEEQSQNINQLEQQVETFKEYSALQLDTLKLQEAQLNKAYFTVGTVSELRDNGIVEREGGILGIGSTPVVRKDFTRENFKEVDIREFDYLPLNTRRADVISVHPVDSYYISGDNSADTLFVEDPSLFWSASKYLVVAVR